MSWKDKMKEFGGGNVAFLSEDGETIKFMVVAEPVLYEGEYKNKPSEKIGCPIVTADGLTILIAGKRLARKLAKHEAKFNDTVFMAIRHGGEGDSNASYELQVLDDVDLALKLIEIAGKEATPEAIAAAIEEARDVVEK